MVDAQEERIATSWSCRSLQPRTKVKRSSFENFAVEPASHPLMSFGVSKKSTERRDARWGDKDLRTTWFWQRAWGTGAQSKMVQGRTQLHQQSYQFQVPKTNPKPHVPACLDRDNLFLSIMLMKEARVSKACNRGASRLGEGIGTRTKRSSQRLRTT
jgi:hypothetical protein